MDRLRAFLGKGVHFKEDVYIYAPNVDDILDIGEGQYSEYLVYGSFNKKAIIKSIEINLGLKATQEQEKAIDEIEGMDDFDFFLGSSDYKEIVRKSLAFFTKRPVETLPNGFLIDNSVYIDKGNYKKFRDIVQNINNIEDKKELPFDSKKSKQRYREMEKRKAQANKNKQLDLKDILSILCTFNGNGIDIFNCKNLTMYQVYEQFERINIYESHYRGLLVWSNGLLKENATLDEWIKKSKM